MNINPRLVVDCRYIITSNSNVPCYMNNIFNYSEGNVMHGFYNVPSCCVAPMFFWNVFHLQEQKQLDSFKVNEWLTLFQKTKNDNKLQKFPFCFHHIPPIQQICHCVQKDSLNVDMLQLYKHEILTNNTIRFNFLTFSPFSMLLEAIYLVNQEILPLFDL